MRLPGPKDLRRFCTVDGWREVTSPRGNTGDHWRYEKVLRRGITLRTKVSHGGATIGAGLFKHILRDQLQVTEEQFWTAVDRGIPPVRPGDEPLPQHERLPHDLVLNLVRRAGLPLSEVGRMTKQQAIDAWQHWLAEGAGGRRESEE